MAIRHNTARFGALLGAIVWASILFINTSDSYEMELITKVLLLGILVIVPLGLSLISNFETENAPRIYRHALLLQPLAATSVVASFFVKPGIVAAIMACGWLVVTAVAGVFGLWRLFRPEFRNANEISISAGLVYLPIGAAWLIMSRLGIQPLGFGDTIVLLTAVHFHFAGFAAPILAGMAGRRLPANGSVRSLFSAAVIAIVVGTPLVATGITLAPSIALAGALVISLGLFLLSMLVAGWIVPSVGFLPAQILLLISSASSLPAMTFACIYAYSIVFKKLLIDIPQMAMTHGVVNAFGFALCGLIAWTIIHISGDGKA